MSSPRNHSNRLQRGAPEPLSDSVVGTATAAPLSEPAGESSSDSLSSLGRALLGAPSDQSILSHLEQLAEASGDWASLAEIYRSVASRPLTLEQQIDLRCRLGRLYSLYLDELDRAIATYRRVLDLAPRLTDIASKLEGLYVRTARWVELAAYLKERGSENQLVDVLARHLPDSIDVQVSSYLELARVCEELMSDPDQAIEAADRALSLDPNSLDASRMLFRLYHAAGRYDRCLDTLDLELAAVDSDPDRIAVLTKMARLCENELGDLDRAAECVENILLIDDQRVDSYRALESYYRRMNLCLELADCYERHSSAEPDPAIQADLLARAAAIYRDEMGDMERAMWAFEQVASLSEQEFGDDDRAISVYWSMLEFDPGNGAADQGLERIYRGGERWHELADLLARRVSLLRGLDGAENRDDLIAAMIGQAELFERELADVDAALATYQDILLLEPEFEPARAALERRLSDPNHASAAARVLESVYRDSGEHAASIRVCEVLIAHAEDAWERSELFVRIAQHQRSLGQAEAALSSYEHALVEDASDEPILDHIEELAGAGNHWKGLAEIYTRLTCRPLGAEIRAELYCRLGRVCRDQLGDVDRAIAAYRSALDLPASAAEAADALEELFARTQRWGQLADYLRRRGGWDNLVDVLTRYLPESVDEQVQNYLDIARVCEDLLHDLDQAIEAADRALSLDPGSLDALATLYRVYYSRGSYEQCLDTLELELGTVSSDEDRIAVLGRMARLCEVELNDLDKAAECVENILLIDEVNTDRYRQLESYYQRMNAWSALAENYQRHISVEPDVAIKVELQRALARLYEDKLHDEASARSIYAGILAQSSDAEAGASGIAEDIHKDIQAELDRLERKQTAPPQ